MRRVQVLAQILPIGRGLASVLMSDQKLNGLANPQCGHSTTAPSLAAAVFSIWRSCDFRPLLPKAETPYINERPKKVNSAPVANIEAISGPVRIPLSIMILILFLNLGAMARKAAMVD